MEAGEKAVADTLPCSIGKSLPGVSSTSAVSWGASPGCSKHRVMRPTQKAMGKKDEEPKKEPARRMRKEEEEANRRRMRTTRCRANLTRCQR